MKNDNRSRGPALGATALCLAMASPLAWSSPWTRGDGQWFILTPTSYTYVDEAFDTDGDRVDRNRFEMIEFTPLIEYGVTDSLTLGLQPKYRRVTIEDDAGNTESNSGLAETDLHVRQRLWHSGDASLAVQLGAKVPVSPDEDSDVPLGRDQVDGELKLAFGNRHHAGEGRIFYTLDGGYRKRWDVPADEAFMNGLLGWTPGGSSWSFMLRSANMVSVSEEDNSQGEVLTALPEYRRHDAQLITSYRFNNSVALSAGVSKTVAGENVGVSNTGFLAMSLPF